MKNRKAKQSKTEHHLTIDPSAGCLPGCPACEPGVNPPPLPKPQSYTPTPWYFDFERSYGAHHGREWEISSGRAGSGIWTAHCQSGHDAAFIVRTVNAHEELLEIAHIMLEQFGKDMQVMWRLKLRDAIAKAEGR